MKAPFLRSPARSSGWAAEAYTLDMASVRKGGSLLESLPRLHGYMERM
jgi:hypothetical protein